MANGCLLLFKSGAVYKLFNEFPSIFIYSSLNLITSTPSFHQKRSRYMYVCLCGIQRRTLKMKIIINYLDFPGESGFLVPDGAYREFAAQCFRSWFRTVHCRWATSALPRILRDVRPTMCTGYAVTLHHIFFWTKNGCARAKNGVVMGKRACKKKIHLG